MVKLEEIKKVADNFRSENGNHKINTDDMLFYIVNRIDYLPCGVHVALIAELTGKIKIMLPLMMVGFTTILGLMYFLYG